LYSAASMCPRSLSAAAQSVASNPRFAPLLAFCFFVLCLAMDATCNRVLFVFACVKGFAGTNGILK